MDAMINGRTPEEIKRWLRWVTYRCDQLEDRCATCECRDDCREYCGSDTYKEALSLIERLESERDAALAKVPKWISVEERLPDAIAESGRVKTTETVFAMDSCGAVHVGYFTVYKYDGSNVFHGVDVELFDDSPSDITRWMPLPKATEEEG